jgi:uncharacterized protein with GYD domain
MATYVTTIKFTSKGIEEVQDTYKRAAAFKTSAKKLGVKVTNIYWTFGPFDGLLVYEAADDEGAMTAMLQLSSQGYVQTATARAFSASDMERILGSLSK